MATRAGPLRDSPSHRCRCAHRLAAGRSTRLAGCPRRRMAPRATASGRAGHQYRGHRFRFGRKRSVFPPCSTALSAAQRCQGTAPLSSTTQLTRRDTHRSPPCAAQPTPLATSPSTGARFAPDEATATSRTMARRSRSATSGLRSGPCFAYEKPLESRLATGSYSSSRYATSSADSSMVTASTKLSS